MPENSNGDSSPASPSIATSSTRVFIITLLIGILMGLVLMGLFGYGLYLFGYISIGDDASQATVHVTEVKVPVCPTCEPTPARSNIIVVTPTMDATQESDATATAACELFNDQYPETPCPTLSQE
jgi:hypothetical protein